MNQLNGNYARNKIPGGFLPVETVTQAFPQSGTTLYVDSTGNKKPWNI
jgi:hypothetical protein